MGGMLVNAVAVMGTARRVQRCVLQSFLLVYIISYRYVKVC